MTTPIIDQLLQLVTATWDGNIIAKEYRDRLYTKGLIERAHGWNFITAKGIEYLTNLGLLKS